VEVIDLRTLSPVDWETITASVTKTNKCSSPTRTRSRGAMAPRSPPASADEWLPVAGRARETGASTDTFVGYAPGSKISSYPR